MIVKSHLLLLQMERTLKSAMAVVQWKALSHKIQSALQMYV